MKLLQKDVVWKIRKIPISAEMQLSAAATCGKRSSSEGLNAQSQYCIFCMCVWQMMAFPQGDRKFPISVMMQSTAENTGHCI